MNDFLKILKVIGYIIFLSPAIIGLIMIATGNGSNDKNSGSWNKKLKAYEKEKYEQQMRESRKPAPQLPLSYPVMNRIPSRQSTPDDAYDEGYSNGYEQGVDDGSRGRSYEYGYDNSCSYYNHYQTKYEEGYESGYQDGYSSGRSRYEDDNEDED